MRLIDADALNGYQFGLISSQAQKLFHKTINNAPTIVPKRRTGRWKRISMDMYVQHAMYYYECSECGAHIIGEHKYCSECGAKMEVTP